LTKNGSKFVALVGMLQSYHAAPSV